MHCWVKSARRLSPTSFSSSLLVQHTLFSAYIPVFTCNFAGHGEALCHAPHPIDDLRASDLKSVESIVNSQDIRP
jgi:hypothetical protein